MGHSLQELPEKRHMGNDFFWDFAWAEFIFALHFFDSLFYNFRLKISPRFFKGIDLKVFNFPHVTFEMASVILNAMWLINILKYPWNYYSEITFFFVFSTMNFNTWITSCNYHSDQGIKEFYHPPKIPLLPFVVKPCPPSPTSDNQ